MKYKLTCKDMGMSDEFEAEGRTKSEVIDKMAKHAKKHHMMTDEEIKSQIMKRAMNEKIWSRKK